MESSAVTDIKMTSDGGHDGDELNQAKRSNPNSEGVVVPTEPDADEEEGAGKSRYSWTESAECPLSALISDLEAKAGHGLEERDRLNDEYLERERSVYAQIKKLDAETLAQTEKLREELQVFRNASRLSRQNLILISKFENARNIRDATVLATSGRCVLIPDNDMYPEAYEDAPWYEDWSKQYCVSNVKIRGRGSEGYKAEDSILVWNKDPNDIEYKTPEGWWKHVSELDGGRARNSVLYGALVNIDGSRPDGDDLGFEGGQEIREWHSKECIVSGYLFGWVHVLHRK